ncbi:flagellar biosynthesis protein FliQ [bacterium]|nr:flagellar biosynthesis protein FliQ [bacterium]
MDQDVVITLLQKCFVLILELSAPVLVVSILVGLLISIFQTVTQIQESTLTFVPKVLAAIVTLIILMPWMLSLFISTVNEMFNTIPSLIMHT